VYTNTATEQNLSPPGPHFLRFKSFLSIFGNTPLRHCWLLDSYQPSRPRPARHPERSATALLPRFASR
jgi:hypothetical protein